MYRASLLTFRPYLNTYEGYLLNLANLIHNSLITFVLDRGYDRLELTSAAMQKFIKHLWSSAIVSNLYTVHDTTVYSCCHFMATLIPSAL